MALLQSILHVGSMPSTEHSLACCLGAVQLGYYEHLYREIARQATMSYRFPTGRHPLVRHPTARETIGQRFLSAGASLIAARKAKGGVIRTVSRLMVAIAL